MGPAVFFGGKGQGIDVMMVPLVENRNDFLCRHARNALNESLGARNPARRERIAPRGDMNRHRIGQRSITVEDQPLYAGRNWNRHSPLDLSFDPTEIPFVPIDNDGHKVTRHILVIQDTGFVNRRRDCSPTTIYNPECLRGVIA